MQRLLYDRQIIEAFTVNFVRYSKSPTLRQRENARGECAALVVKHGYDDLGLRSNITFCSRFGYDVSKEGHLHLRELRKLHKDAEDVACRETKPMSTLTWRKSTG